ncbi:MAG: NTP transferase domain-containing protein [Nitrospina sp.]|jgi:UDP-N-acetylglucosamine diphosphorylase / glucose-1-phosphate thymidylyltransferase / UDP-N-acetylgalactosamine diphosphorylase / glucosamine-1-phosphate N-acetyltransferase / galactosamine-1-phosphate N-acetyltransferase|nr:NTP transferase domain-containing protein [Nitrospina sp.]MBT3414760.1 NTP transferase domain-containing protein [Nitrospina sp.]MBT3855334.1 NTP transferase domain-containing protein [Nitrospina sp.]MBT4104119.1 NTP transferase domain-containing protein [Nitrospina sp.]MBT4621253.1 NTP transferase domain-containing protein [Nitrospina sp.]
MKAIILAAGEAAHLSPFSETRPISMIGVAGRTMLDNTFALLKSAGINDIFIVVGHKKDKLIERLQQQDHNGLNLHYVEQKRKLGIGHAVMQVKNKISPGEYFLLLYGDTLTAENIFSKVQQSFHSFKCPVASICLPPSNQMFGNVFLNARMEITKIVEKPKGNNLGNYVLSGVFILPASFFKLLESSGKSMEKALKKVVAEEGLRASMWEDEWLDVVHPWEILTANKMIMDSWQESSIAKTATLEANVTLQGIVRIEAGAIIKSGAVLEGPCCIGEGSYIGNNSLIRSYTSVGKKCSVGSGVELKNCVVMDNSQIGRLSFVGDSVLGENVDMGAGCMTVNRTVDWKPISVKNGKRPMETGMTKLGAFLGDGVVVGAGNTLQPGTVVAPGKILPACYSVTQK